MCVYMDEHLSLSLSLYIYIKIIHARKRYMLVPFDAQGSR